MKNYEVTLMATSYKTVEICADSEQEALKMARDIYYQTDALDFTDDDVEEIAAQADELEDDEDEDDELSQLQEDFEECLREAHLAADDLERVIDRIEDFYNRNRD